MIDRLLRSFRLALWSPRIVSHGGKDEDRITKNVVRLFSHGNIRLQRGEFFTEKDIKERYDRIKSFDFLQ